MEREEDSLRHKRSARLLSFFDDGRGTKREGSKNGVIERTFSRFLVVSPSFFSLIYYIEVRRSHRADHRSAVSADADRELSCSCLCWSLKQLMIVTTRRDEDERRRACREYHDTPCISLCVLHFVKEQARFVHRSPEICFATGSSCLHFVQAPTQSVSLKRKRKNKPKAADGSCVYFVADKVA